MPTPRATPATNPVKTAPVEAPQASDDAAGGGAIPMEFFCQYCQRHKKGKFFLTGNYGTTRICEECMESRKKARSFAARSAAAAKARLARGAAR
jgi:hypothetical protein